MLRMIIIIQNHMIERVWVEVNTRVNYPLKRALIEMMDAGCFDLDNTLHIFCVSCVTQRVAGVGVKLFISSWNNHPIPGKYF